VTWVAWDVGFASLGTFSRTFSTVVGCSPTEFRARHEPLHVPSASRIGQLVEVTSEEIQRAYDAAR
jgi:AraC-like DNA-binding protein